MIRAEEMEKTAGSEMRRRAKWEVWDRWSQSQIALNYQERKFLPLVSF